MVSQPPAIVGPMKHCLALPGPAGKGGFTAVLFDLSYMPLYGFPSLYLPQVFFWKAPAHIVAAVPLEPSARVILMNPAFFYPNRQRLAGVNLEIIQLRIVPLGAKLCFLKPACRKFFAAVSHIFPAKNTQFQHFPGSKLRLKIRGKIFAFRLGKDIAVIALHLIINDYCFPFHRQKSPQFALRAQY